MSGYLLMINLTRVRLIEDWVSDILKQYERISNAPISLPIPILDLAEKIFHVRVDEEYFRGKLSHTSGIIVPLKRWIILNKAQSHSRMNFTLAHELGHWWIVSEERELGDLDAPILHRVAKDGQKEQENFADHFAAEIMMPISLLMEELKKYPKMEGSDVCSLARTFDVSPKALTVRLKELNRRAHMPNISWGLGDLTDSAPIMVSSKQKPKWKHTVVRVDSSIVDHSLYRRLKDLRNESNNLYVIAAESTKSSIETLLEFDCVDGFIIISPECEDDLATMLTADPSIRFLVLENDQWLQHLLSEKPTRLSVNSDHAFIFSTRFLDGDLTYEQQRFTDLACFIEPTLKLHYREAARKYIRDMKEIGKRVVIVTGCFDLITNAHVKFLKRAKAAGDILVVGIEDDTRVRTFKGPYRPVNTITQRIELMEAFGFVDFTFVIKGSTTKSDIKSFYTRLHRDLKANVLAVSEGDPYIQDRKDEIEAGGGELVAVSRFEEGSTTSVIRRFLAKTELSDMVFFSKSELKEFVSENQNSWRQLSMPFTVDIKKESS